MKKKLQFKKLLLMALMLVGAGTAWAADGDTHDFAQTLQQLLNNNASINPINIEEQEYAVKKVIVSYRYNKTITNAVTVSVSVGGNDWGSQYVNGTGNNYSTLEFSGEEAIKGAIAISFTNNTGSGTGHGTFYVDKVQLVEGAVAETGTTAAPTITGESSFLDKTTVTITNAASAEGATIYYTTNGDDPTTSSSIYSDPFEITTTTTVKAIAKKASDTNASSVVTKTFTKITPLTVAQALTAINALDDNGTIDDQYVSGVVSKAGSLNSDNTITYSISDDGSTTNQLQVYKGKGLNNENFTDASDIQVGDVVVVFGQLKKYKSGSNVTPEFNSGNYLVSHTSKPAPTFTLNPTTATLDAYSHETVDVTLTTNTDGTITCESSNEDVATVALKNGNIYTITAQTTGTATITIKSALSANYAPASATVEVTVTDNRDEAGISFEEATITKTWGEEFTGQDLTNTNNVPVTWSSTDETVATVNTTGVVTVQKAGTTTIKATFAGNENYKAAIASYTLTVNKAAAGISYAQTVFDIMLNDDSFEAPELVNPNNLTVTYASNNTTIAEVDENTGELIYDETVTGTAEITATFAGNDNYYSGSASYTINIIDPTVKGTKYNPYTVAEVIDGTATGSGIYVKGFIVGEYVGKTTDPRTTGFTTDANIAIADEFTTSPTAAGSIPVQLGNDNLKNAWGCKTSSGALIGYEILVKGNKDTYFTVNGIKGTSEITAVSVSATVTAAGLATFASDYNLDFSSVTGLEAYAAEEENCEINLTKVTEVPAGEGVLLRAKAITETTTFIVPIITEATWSEEGNLFVRGTGAAVASSNSDIGPYNYILNNVGGVLGFYRANNQIVAKNKAYLQTSINTAAEGGRLLIRFDDETTGIKDNNREAITNNRYFDLQGREVAQPTKGLYIVNGKKVIIR